MKTPILLPILIAGIFLAGCSKGKEGTDNCGDPVAIRLNSGISDAAHTGTKVPVEVSADVQIEGWESKSVVDYSTPSAWQSTAKVTVNSDAQGIVLSPARYYNADGSVKTAIKGWHPQSVSSAGTVTFTNTDGTLDVLYAKEVAGTKGTPVSEALLFNHKSVQLVFKVKKGEGLASGTKIKTIKVKNTAIPISIALETDKVNYTEKSELPVPGLESVEIEDEGKIVGFPVMVRPEEDNTTVKLFIETTTDGSTVAATYDEVIFNTSDGKLSEGSAYTIELTFSQGGVSLTANIAPWVSATGSGTVM